MGRFKIIYFLFLFISVAFHSAWAGSLIPSLTGAIYPQLKKTDLASLGLGKPLVLSFFSVTCYPCRLEAPVLNELSQDYEKKGVRFIYVNLDDTNLRKRIPAYLKLTKVPFLVFLPSVDQVYERFLVTGLPYLIVYDAQGNEVYRHAGFDPDLKQSLTDTLKKLAP